MTTTQGEGRGVAISHSVWHLFLHKLMSISPGYSSTQKHTTPRPIQVKEEAKCYRQRSPEDVCQRHEHYARTQCGMSARKAKIVSPDKNGAGRVRTCASLDNRYGAKGVAFKSVGLDHSPTTPRSWAIFIRYIYRAVNWTDSPSLWEQDLAPAWISSGSLHHAPEKRDACCSELIPMEASVLVLSLHRG